MSITSDEIKELKKKMKSVPFGNSAFQNIHFTAGKEGKERRYRHCLLQINQKLNALQECQFRRQRIEIDICEINEKLLTAKGFDRERLIVDLEEKEWNLENEIKLIEDALIEMETYKTIIAEMPDITREQFEQAEHKYWRTRLLDDARREFLSSGTVSIGTLASLEATGLVIGKNENGLITYTEKEICG